MIKTVTSIWKKVGSIFILLLVVVVQFQFMYQNEHNEWYKERVRFQLNTTSEAIGKLEHMARLYKAKQVPLDSLQSKLRQARIAFKQIESVLEYYYPEHVKAYINGAPLDHLDPYPVGEGYNEQSNYGYTVEEYLNTVPLDKMDSGHFLDGSSPVIAPVGLQRLDELIFTDEATTEQERIVTLATELSAKFVVIQNDLLLRKYFYDFEVIEFSRLELIRIVSRGITGFDTPGSLNAMEEALAALSGMETLLKPLIADGSIEKQQLINELFAGAQEYLKNNTDFETFDRLVFIKEYLNPLYEKLLRLQQELGIESSAETYVQTPSWNAYSSNIFDNDFLNPYYYSILKAKEDSPELRDLGKQLFFDTNLSGNKTMSCASCHQPDLAYTDGVKTSQASVPGKRVLRNSPTLVNAVFSDRFFYDLRAFDLEDQAGHVIENHMEFNTSYKEIVAKLNADVAYQEQFKSVFHKDKITRYHFSKALASFVISLRSFDSEFDKYMRGEPNKLSKKAKKGFNLFMGKANCGTCHYAPTFSGLVPPLFNENESEVLGILQSPNSKEIDTDKGRFENGVDTEDAYINNHSFKTVTVRNIQLTAPYFHNGAYTTLDEVLEFYNNGGAAGVGLEEKAPNQTLAPDPLNLSKSELKELKAFLESLNAIPSN
ncbi:cytochrome c peroxidase [Pustulibacterium marinum]|uniref:Cytochrome c peroxidase n=1 Tax=Pustulibacterium marinum TaxID=1224947 RepID=A0A1I7HLV5_9FLAO|nr:cytochrome c peroxidase [Pustulibacterium marinum]SFU61673.1 cytochrome c peroxidase [Pustulibacterium marinum]